MYNKLLNLCSFISTLSLEFDTLLFCSSTHINCVIKMNDINHVSDLNEKNEYTTILF